MSDDRITSPEWLRYWLVSDLIEARPYASPDEIIKQSEKYYNYINQTREFAKIREVINK